MYTLYILQYIYLHISYIYKYIYNYIYMRIIYMNAVRLLCNLPPVTLRCAQHLAHALRRAQHLAQTGCP